MSAEFDRRLNDWFDAVEPKTIPADLLSTVVDEVGRTGQQRKPWHRFGASIEAAWPRPQVSIGSVLLLITALLLALLVAAVAGGFIRLPSRPTLFDGLIAVQDQQLTEGSQRIRFVDPITGAEAFSTPTSERACGAQFSPDGSQYALLYQNAAGEIWVAVAPVQSAFRPTLLALKEGQMYFDPGWSPDGRTLVTTMDNGEIWVLPTDASVGRRLTDVETSFSADWSADGSWISFVGVGPVHPLLIIRPDSSDLRTLVPSGVDSAAWSPLSNELAYAGADGKLHVISANGDERFVSDEARQPPSDSGEASLPAPAWSDDGAKVAVTRDGVVQVFDLAAGSVATMSLPSPIVRSAWSASGQSLAVATSGAESLEGDLWEVPIDGGQARLIAQGVRGKCMSSAAALSWQRVSQR